MKNLMD